MSEVTDARATKSPTHDAGLHRLEERVSRDHPLRAIKGLADYALAELSPTFDAMYAEVGRPSIPPERLLKASLLIALYSARSERAFCEELEYNLLFRWFLDMDPIEPGFDPTVFTKNRERLLRHGTGQRLFDEVVARAHERGPLSDEHFTVARTASRRTPLTMTGATPPSTSTGRSARTPPTGAPPIRTRG